MGKQKTKMQEKILEFCKAYFKEHGYAPTIREIASGVGLKSTSSTMVWMDKMYDGGVIASEHRGFPRAFRIVETDENSDSNQET